MGTAGMNITLLIYLFYYKGPITPIYINMKEY
jgi:hypothetical protein